MTDSVFLFQRHFGERALFREWTEDGVVPETLLPPRRFDDGAFHSPFGECFSTVRSHESDNSSETCRPSRGWNTAQLFEEERDILGVSRALPGKAYGMDAWATAQRSAAGASRNWAIRASLDALMPSPSRRPRGWPGR